MARTRSETKAMRSTDITQRVGRYLLTHPEDIEDVAKWAGVRPETARSWSKANASSGGFTILFMESWLRRKNLLPVFQLSERPTLSEALTYGISEKVLDASTIASKLGILPLHRLLAYADGELAPRGILKLRLEWELSQLVVVNRIKQSRPLYIMSHFDGLVPELEGLVTACCKGDLTVEVIANQLGVTPHRAKEWLFWKNSVPTGEMLERIRVEFAPYLTSESLGAKQLPVTKSVIAGTPRRPAKPKVVSGISKAGVSAQTGLMTTPENLVVNAAEVALVVLRGYIDSRQPSDAIHEIDFLREKHPDLFYVLSLVTRVMADPQEQYPKWRKAK